MRRLRPDTNCKPFAFYCGHKSARAPSGTSGAAGGEVQTMCGSAFLRFSASHRLRTATVARATAASRTIIPASFCQRQPPSGTRSQPRGSGVFGEYFAPPAPAAYQIEFFGTCRATTRDMQGYSLSSYAEERVRESCHRYIVLGHPFPMRLPERNPGNLPDFVRHVRWHSGGTFWHRAALVWRGVSIRRKRPPEGFSGQSKRKSYFGTAKRFQKRGLLR